MNLAKPRIDIGFATNNAPAALAFWQNQIGLPFDHTQPIRRGYKQHRHDLCGSILKINQVYEPLPDNPPSGYRELLIARDGILAREPMIDPDGNRVSLVPEAMFGIERIGIRLGRSEEHTSELQSHLNLVCRLLLEKKKIQGLNHQRTYRRVTADTERDR